MQQNVWKVIVGVVAAVIMLPRDGQARYYSERDRNLSLAVEYRMESYFGIEGPSSVISQRNELKIEGEYKDFLRALRGGAKGGPRLDFYVQFRPWYDTVYNMGSGGMSKNSVLHQDWRMNLDWSEDTRDPFLREIYLDVNWGNFYGRLGRQIIAWGKSDGVYMLDLINPFNFRTPFIFEEEDIKIPLWMLNLNYRIGVNGNFQVLWIPWYVNAKYPGYRPKETVGGLEVFQQGGATGNEPRRHAFEFNSVTFTNEFYQGVGEIFREQGIPEGFPIRPRRPASTLENSMVALRWSHVFGDFNYTLNYFYTWTQFMADFPDTGDFLTATSVIRRPSRLHVVGGSWDYPLSWAPAFLKGLVWRGETALQIDDLFVIGDPKSPKFFAPDRVDHLGLMMGFDNTYNIDLTRWVPRKYLDPIWYISLQYWQDWILDPIRVKDAYYDIGAGTPSWATNQIGEGRRDDIKQQLTLFITKDMLPGDVLHGEFFTLYGISFNDWWLRARMRYEISDNINVALGINEFLGGRFDPYGQYGTRSHIWMELRYVLL